jgi:quinol monooxygenase YgiN
MLVIRAEIPIDPASREKAIETLSDLRSKSLKEEGIISYRVTTDIEDENLFQIVEQYESEEALNSHMQEEHTQAFLEQLPDLAAGEIDALRFDVESASELEV